MLKHVDMPADKKTELLRRRRDAYHLKKGVLGHAARITEQAPISDGLAPVVAPALGTPRAASGLAGMGGCLAAFYSPYTTLPTCGTPPSKVVSPSSRARLLKFGLGGGAGIGYVMPAKRAQLRKPLQPISNVDLGSANRVVDSPLSARAVHLSRCGQLNPPPIGLSVADGSLNLHTEAPQQSSPLLSSKQSSLYSFISPDKQEAILRGKRALYASKKVARQGSSATSSLGERLSACKISAACHVAIEIP